jgi:Uncharacterised nucleotidyltransferase
MTSRTIWKPTMEMRPELELVFCCARLRPDASNQDRIRALLRGQLDWAEVLAAAVRHKLLPILYERLSTLDAGLVNQNHWKMLGEGVRESGKNSLLLFGEMLRLQALFEAEQVPAIPYKGPVLAWLAYRSITSRMFSDLDFAVPQRHIPRVTSLLQTAGYQAQFNHKEIDAGQEGHAPGQYSFFSEGCAIHTEIHTERTLRYFPRPLDFEEMNSRLISVEIAGRKLRTFSVEDTLVMLSVHGAKHFWERLLWIVDVAELTHSRPVDWPQAMKIAADLRSTRVFLLGLYLAGEWLGAAVPQTILERTRRDRKIRWLAARVGDQWVTKPNPAAGVLPRAAFRIQSRDGLGQGILHMLRLAMSPTETDRRSVWLPRRLAPFYAFARPWRLLRDYGLGLRSRPKKIQDLAKHDAPQGPPMHSMGPSRDNNS